jgi:hypothetical protein
MRGQAHPGSGGGRVPRLPNEPEPRESDAGKDDGLHRQNHPMNSCRVGEDRFYVSEVNRHSDGAGALSGAFLAKLYQPVAAEFRQTQPPQLPL